MLHYKLPAFGVGDDDLTPDCFVGPPSEEDHSQSRLYFKPAMLTFEEKLKQVQDVLEKPSERKDFDDKFLQKRAVHLADRATAENWDTTVRESKMFKALLGRVLRRKPVRRSQVYDKFIEDWFQREIEKLSRAGSSVSAAEGKEDATSFAKITAELRDDVNDDLSPETRETRRRMSWKVAHISHHLFAVTVYRQSMHRVQRPELLTELSMTVFSG